LLANQLVGVFRGNSSRKVIRDPLRTFRIAAILLPIFFHSIPCSAAEAFSPITTLPHAVALESYPNIIVERRIEIPLRDGVKLRATLFRPDAPGRFPAIVYRTPYGQEDYAAEPEFPIKAAHRGYLVFLVDVRAPTVSSRPTAMKNRMDTTSSNGRPPTREATVGWAPTVSPTRASFSGWRFPRIHRTT